MYLEYGQVKYNKHVFHNEGQSIQIFQIENFTTIRTDEHRYKKKEHPIEKIFQSHPKQATNSEQPAQNARTRKRANKRKTKHTHTRESSEFALLFHFSQFSGERLDSLSRSRVGHNTRTLFMPLPFINIS